MEFSLRRWKELNTGIIQDVTFSIEGTDRFLKFTLPGYKHKVVIP